MDVGGDRQAGDARGATAGGRRRLSDEAIASGARPARPVVATWPSDCGSRTEPQVLEGGVGWRGRLVRSGQFADLVVVEPVEAPADLGQRQMLGLEPPDEPKPREVTGAVLAARTRLADGRQGAPGTGSSGRSVS